MGRFSLLNRFSGRLSNDNWLGLACVVGAVAVLVLWIRFDIDTGLYETARRQLRIGDALLPTLACGFVIAGGLMVLFQRSDLSKAGNEIQPARRDFLRLLAVFSVLILALSLMRWTGEITTFLFSETGDYRVLRDTVPFKYLGFISGGTMLVTGLIMLSERRLSLRALVIGLATSLVLIAVYDFPFDDLLLPPNGDF